MSAQPAARAFAPGKLILSGEHAVVYGHPAVAVAVDRGTTVGLHRRPGPTRVERAILHDRRLHEAMRSILPESGVGVSIESDLPVGRGMGSSAALAIALVRAWWALEGREPTFEDLHREGFKVERVFHGRPSGIDHAVAALAAPVRYRKGDEGPDLSPLAMPRLQLVVLDTGLAGDTQALVQGVADRRPAVDPLLSRIGALTAELIDALATDQPPAVLGELLTENHRLLAQIGVSTPNLDRLVGFARKAGAHGAKLAGAGGGGVVLALVDDPALLLNAAGKAGIPAFSVQVGG